MWDATVFMLMIVAARYRLSFSEISSIHKQSSHKMTKRKQQGAAVLLLVAYSATSK
jgi:hypothetical protein